jgi:hypothetical protein
MERRVGTTDLRRRLTDILLAVREQRATYIVETFDRSQAALISLEEYRLFQRYMRDRDAFHAWLEDSGAGGQPAGPEASDEDLLLHLERAIEGLAALEAIPEHPSDLADVVARLEEIVQQQRQAAVPQGAFGRILERASDLGVSDLAEQHDHYLYGLDKR